MPRQALTVSLISLHLVYVQDDGLRIVIDREVMHQERDLLFSESGRRVRIRRQQDVLNGQTGVVCLRVSRIHTYDAALTKAQVLA